MNVKSPVDVLNIGVITSCVSGSGNVLGPVRTRVHVCVCVCPSVHPSVKVKGHRSRSQGQSC